VDRVAALELGADDCCQFQRYLRIRADRAEINANVAMLFADGVCERDLPRNSSMPSDLVMICQWASLFTQSMDSRMTICSGGSNGSAALATIRAFPSEPPNRCQPSAAPQGREEPAQRAPPSNCTAGQQFERSGHRGCVNTQWFSGGALCSRL
jgi:hypothetical protein